MKTIQLVACLFVFGSALCVASEEQNETPSELFVSQVTGAMERNLFDVTEEQQSALRTIHPLLVFCADTDLARPGVFWSLVTHHEVAEIDAESAEQLILQGRITLVGWTHHGVLLHEYNGHRYRVVSGEPRLVREAVDRVDPTGVFITVGSE